jgi:tetratricopeptide (TPR) repeat protein
MFLSPKLFVVFVTTMMVLAADCVMAKSERERERLVDLVLQQLYTEEYDSALTSCLNIQQLWPEDPTATLLQLSIYQTQMRNYRVRIFESEFDMLIKRAAKLAKKQVRKNPTAEFLFMQGSVRGMQAFHRFKQGNWSKGLKDIVVALQSMNKALRKDAAFADPKLALGLYKFWVSQKLDFGIGLQKNKRNDALRLIEDVWKHGRYLSIDAAFTLQNILLHKEEYDRALEINDWLKDRFPKHPSVLYHRALLLEKLERSSDALQCWADLISRIQSFQIQSSGYLAECFLHRAQICEANLLVGYHGDQRKEIQNAVIRAASYAERRDASIELESSYQKFDEINDAIKKMQKKYSSLEIGS